MCAWKHKIHQNNAPVHWSLFLLPAFGKGENGEAWSKQKKSEQTSIKKSYCLLAVMPKNNLNVVDIPDSDTFW